MDRIKQLRRDILETSFKSNACHIGSSLSAIKPLLLILSKMKKKDRLIFSKASGACTYYILLSEAGHFPKKKLPFFLKQYPLSNKKVPGVIHSVGSVGMGLSVAVGLALSNRGRNVFCLISDGQLDEGVTYEAALFSRQHKLNNLFVVCDDNGFQAMGKTKEILDLETAFEFYKKTFPNFERVKTIKGEGVSFLEGKTESHYMNLTPELLDQALKELC